MHGSCAPPPCPPPDCSEPLGDWGGAGALDELTGAYAEQSTNASGLDLGDGVPGITIDDSGLGGDGTVITTILDIAGDVVLPVTAAAAAATGIIGLAALGKIIGAINGHIKKVKHLDKRIGVLAAQAQDMLDDLTKVSRKGVKDEWLKSDIAKAGSVLRKVEAYCEELSKEKFLKKYITQSKKREQQVTALVTEFQSMRQNLTTVSVLELRRVVVDMMMPTMDRIEGQLESVAGALAKSAQASTEHLSTTVTSTTTTTETTTKSKSRTKTSSKSEQRKSRTGEPKKREDVEPRPNSRASSRHSCREPDSDYSVDLSYQQYDAYSQQQYLDVEQHWDGYQGRPRSPSSQCDAGRRYDSDYWQQRSGRYYSDNGQDETDDYPSSTSGYHSDGGASYSYSWREQARLAEEEAWRIGGQAHWEAQATAHRGLQTQSAAQQKAQALRDKGRQTHHAAQQKAQAMREKAHLKGDALRSRAGSNVSVNSWREGDNVYTTVDNSVYDNSSVMYGDTVTVNRYVY